MLSNQILQNAIDGLKGIMRRDIAVADVDGKIVATTEDGRLGVLVDDAEYFVYSKAESQLVNDTHYFKVTDNGVTEYIALVRGGGEDGYLTGQIVAFHLQNLLVAYKERFDKDNFIKNLLLDNLLLVDIHGRAKKLRIDVAARRVVYLIEVDNAGEFSVIETVRTLFAAKARDFVTAIDESGVILVKELRDADDVDEIEREARRICDTLSAETLTNVRIAIGTVAADLQHVSSSLKEAQMALEVGKIFEAEKRVVSYYRLGIGRLIYQLPAQLCRMFLQEALGGADVNKVDEEILSTVDKFFENSLNVSETSRQLFIHRNTLVYRLDRLQQLTGLDLRRFDDAITMKITLMVEKYMRHIEGFE